MTTGEVARLLGTAEPRVANTVRCGWIQPAPRIVAGRRQWFLDQVVQAAEVLELLTPDLEARLNEEEAR